MARRGSGGRQSAVYIAGLPELRRELRRLENPREWTKQLGTVQRDLAKDVARWSTSAAVGEGGATKHFAKMLSGRGNLRGARVMVRNPIANAGFWGAKQRTGWNAGNSTPNLPRWIGNQWEVGGAGGPYAINATIRERMDDILRQYREGIDDITRRAFPD